MTATADAELKRLLEAALDIVKIDDPAKRHAGGFWLQGQCETFANTHTSLSSEEEIDFLVIGKILLETIFSDAIEDTSDMREMLVRPSQYDTAIVQAQKAAMDRHPLAP